MVLRGSASAVVLVLAAALGCGGGDGGTGPIAAALVGRWEASAACRPRCGFTLRSVANPADSLELVGALSASFVLRLERSGAFRVDFVTLLSDTSFAGTARTQGAVLVLSASGGVAADTVDYTLAAEVLELRFRERVRVWDFTGDGVADEATARAVLVQR